MDRLFGKDALAVSIIFHEHFTLAMGNLEGCNVRQVFKLVGY